METISSTLASATSSDSSNVIRTLGISAIVGVGLYQLLKSDNKTTTKLAHNVEERIHDIQDRVQAATTAAAETVAQKTLAVKQLIHPNKTHKQIAVVTPAAEVARVAYAHSDVVFVYRSGLADEQAQLLADWSRAETKNAAGHVPSFQEFDVRAGAGTALMGALSAGSAVSVLTSSQALPSLTSALFAIGQQKRGVAIHVALNAITDDLDEHVDTAPLHLVAELGLRILSSGSAQEIADNAIYAQQLARSGVPVVHVFDGVRVGRTARRIVQTSMPVSSSVSAPAPPSFRFVGSKKARVTVVVLSALSQSFEHACMHANSSASFDNAVGVLVVNQLRPWTAQDFLAALPATVRVVGVVDAGPNATGVSILQPASAALVGSSTAPKLVLRRIQIGSEGVSLELARDVIQSVALTSLENVAQSSVNIPAPPTASDDAALSSAYTAVAVWGQYDVDTVVSLAARAASARLQLDVAAFVSHDQYTAGGVTFAELLTSSPGSKLPQIACSVSAHHAALVTSPRTFTTFARQIVSRVGHGGQIVVLGDVTADVLSEELPLGIRLEMLTKQIVLQSDRVGCDASVAVTVRSLTMLGPLLALATRSDVQPVVKDALVLAGLEAAAALKLAEVSQRRLSELSTVTLPASWKMEDALLDTSLSEDTPTATFLPKARVLTKAQADARPKQVSKAEAAWRMMYAESYASQNGVRPGYHGIFRVKVTKNERLTPTEYHRNVFHLEME